MDQDFVHNHKKLVNHLFHASCVICMGPYFVHSNHLLLVCEGFGQVAYGLGQTEFERIDQQKLAIGTKICFLWV